MISKEDLNFKSFVVKNITFYSIQFVDFGQIIYYLHIKLKTCALGYGSESQYKILVDGKVYF
jgi:hypothetical protein